MLYLCLWIATILVVFRGDFTSLPSDYVDNHHDSIFWLWAGLSLVCPPLALGALHLIESSKGERKYRGFWLRLGADVGQACALTVYTLIRITTGDFHVYPRGALIACVIFAWHLVMRDARRLIEVEKLANMLHRRGDGS